MKSKDNFRRECIKRLKRYAKTRGYIYDKIIINRLKGILKSRDIKSVMCYIPIDIEANITPLINWLRAKGILVYVPFMEGKSFRLVKYRLPLRKKRFGIYEPKISKQYRKKRIDIAIVPVIGIDRLNRRIGFGKGMYDRFFAKESKNIKETIFVQRTLCQSPKIITDNYDIKGDTIVTGRFTTY